VRPPVTVRATVPDHSGITVRGSTSSGSIRRAAIAPVPITPRPATAPAPRSSCRREAERGRGAGSCPVRADPAPAGPSGRCMPPAYRAGVPAPAPSTMGTRTPSPAPRPRTPKGRPMLRLSTLFVRTLREDPADAEVTSHKLLVRAGYIRRSAAGVYTWLPLGLKVLRKVEQIVREEQDAIGAQEVLFSALQPREPYEATGRWEEYGPTLFRLQDRRQDDYLLAPTHEEMFTLTVKDLYSSYKDLPAMLYQIQTKFRDEARPRAGLLRTREFITTDAYSFDVND